MALKTISIAVTNHMPSVKGKGHVVDNKFSSHDMAHNTCTVIRNITIQLLLHLLSPVLAQIQAHF